MLVLTPLLSWVLVRLGRRGREISTPGKMACGLVATSAAFVVIELAGLRGGDEGQVSLFWLSGCYVLLTRGELLLAPMGLALVTCLAPSERALRMVALWCVAKAVGNALAGALGILWTRWLHHRYFALLAILPLGAAAVLLARLRGLERLLRVECAPRAPDQGAGDRAEGQEGCSGRLGRAEGSRSARGRRREDIDAIQEEFQQGRRRSAAGRSGDGSLVDPYGSLNTTARRSLLSLRRPALRAAVKTTGSHHRVSDFSCK